MDWKSFFYPNEDGYSYINKDMIRTPSPNPPYLYCSIYNPLAVYHEQNHEIKQSKIYANKCYVSYYRLIKIGQKLNSENIMNLNDDDLLNYANLLHDFLRENRYQFYKYYKNKFKIHIQCSYENRDKTMKAIMKLLEIDEFNHSIDDMKIKKNKEINSLPTIVLYCRQGVDDDDSIQKANTALRYLMKDSFPKEPISIYPRFNKRLGKNLFIASGASIYWVRPSISRCGHLFIDAGIY